jgi:hypothetical protein
MLAIRAYRNEPDYSFPDGQVAGYTSLGYSGGDTLVSEPVTTRELDSWLVAYRTVLLTKIRKQTQGRRAVDGTQFVVTPVSLDSPRSSAYHLYGPRYDVALAVGDRLLQTAITSTTSDVDGGHAFLESFVKSVSPRALFELPGGPGVCLPHAFIRDDNVHPRGVAVTYRLKSHPDVSIWLFDANGAGLAGTHDGDAGTAKHDIAMFWNQRYQDSERYRLVATEAIEINGQRGLSSVVELTRKDGTLDPGFFASVRGVVNKDGEATDIQLFVIRDARLALAKGIKAMDKDEMLKLAHAVAASAKTRPIR